MMIPLPSLVIEIASSALRLFNHPRVDGHEIINNRGDSSIHLPSDEKSSIKSFSRVKLTGMIIHASSIHPLPREQTRSKHPRKCRPGVGLGLVEPFYGGEGIVILLWLIVEERKRKREGESINSDALEIPLLPFENASNAWLVLILGHESFKIKQFRFMSIDLIRIYRDCNRKKIIFVWFYEFVLLNFGNKVEFFVPILK